MDSAATSSQNSPLDNFVFAWRKMHDLAKKLQYSEVTRLSELNSLRLQLESLSLVGTPEAEEQTLLIAEEIARLQALGRTSMEVVEQRQVSSFGRHFVALFSEKVQKEKEQVYDSCFDHGDR
ncbi:hypothetical protein R1flu_020228 [Riccia fluitans]|uniref:Uncharacterized protein n=1 Tax=Riccia fluitans TaxID=41844 RepID=A0ABD1ZMD3_9MARC